MSRRWASMAIALAVTFVGATFWPQLAEARSTSVVSYPPGDVWASAIRFLRVDRDYAIKEKDEAAGYVVFEAVENKRPYRATLELVKTTDGEGRAATQVILSVQELPKHYEVMLLDKLATKLRDERGAPVSPPPKRAPAPSSPPGGDVNPPKAPTKPELPKPPTWGPGSNDGTRNR